MTIGEVTINIVDNGGAVVVPGSTVQAVIGCAASGPVATVVATRNLNTLKGIFGNGPLTQAAALTILKGGVVLAVRAAANVVGMLLGSDAATVPVTGATNVNPIVVTAVAHGRKTGDLVTIASVAGNTAANGTHRITKLTADTFSLDGVAGSGAYTSGGTVANTGVNMLGTGTSVITVTGTPRDDMNAQAVVVAGGTIGTAGITFKLTGDAARHFGPTIALGTATTFAIDDTGLTLNFGAGTLVAGDTVQFSTVAPQWNASGVNACLDALNSSQYGVAGWGSGHIVGPISAADMATVQTKLDSLATTYFLYSRFQFTARDASPPTAWGGTGETEVAWSTAIALDFSSASAKRCLVGGGYYNTPSAYPNAHLGSPSYRRPATWSQAARQVTLPPQRHSGRVRDGSLDTIAIDKANDPSDGFVYHDEFFNPTLSVARFCALRTRKGKPGYFVDQPYLMSPPGSDFDILPKGNVIDVACSIAHQVGENEINDDLTLNRDGTLTETDRRGLETTMGQAIKVNQLDTKQISAYSVAVDPDTNVAVAKEVKTAITIKSRGYVLSETITIGYASAQAAA